MCLRFLEVLPREAKLTHRSMQCANLAILRSPVWDSCALVLLPGCTTSGVTLHPGVGVPGIPSPAVSWLPHGRSWNSHGIFKLDRVSLGGLPEARGKWLAEILIEFHHGMDSIVHMHQRFVHGIAFGHEFREHRTGHGIATFRLPSADKRDFINMHHIVHLLLPFPFGPRSFCSGRYRTLGLLILSTQRIWAEGPLRVVMVSFGSSNVLPPALILALAPWWFSKL